MDESTSLLHEYPRSVSMRTNFAAFNSFDNPIMDLNLMGLNDLGDDADDNLWSLRDTRLRVGFLE